MLRVIPELGRSATANLSGPLSGRRHELIYRQGPDSTQMLSQLQRKHVQMRTINALAVLFAQKAKAFRVC